MMAYDTFTVIPNRGGSRDTTKRGKQTEFADGYKQEVIVGLRTVAKDVTFAYSGTYAEVTAIEKFFDDHATVPFYFQFMPSDPLRLYKVKDTYSTVHDGGLKWTISTSFTEYLGY